MTINYENVQVGLEMKYAPVNAQSHKLDIPLEISVIRGSVGGNPFVLDMTRPQTIDCVF